MIRWLCGLLLGHVDEVDDFGQDRCALCHRVEVVIAHPLTGVVMDGPGSMRPGSAVRERTMRPEVPPQHPEEGFDLIGGW